MEPLHPKLRESLKRAHPGLTDDEIDTVEQLLSQRFDLDPETDADRIETLDRERARLISEKIPNYERVCQDFRSS